VIARASVRPDILRRPGARLGLALLATLGLVATLGPLMLPDPAHQGNLLTASLQAPGGSHPFGTDQLSRDVLSRVVSGLRLSLVIGFLAALLAVGLGTGVGLAAATLGGTAESAIMRIVDALLAIPRLFVLLLAAAAWERIPLAALVLLLGLTGWYGTSRLVRADVARIRDEPFAAAALGLGASRWRVALRHFLPNVAATVLVAATLAVGDVILLEAGLSFLGLGVRPPTPSLGGMIFESRSVAAIAPWTSIFPGLAIVLTVLAVNLVGDAIRDALDPRSS
jgi:ABC-type dipeptide/oligopeptide/nickel transport system permease subunit